MMNIYFDNSATTVVDSRVVNAMNKVFTEDYANPSAMHRFGFSTDLIVRGANEYIASVIGANKNEIIWTSGGSESNNLAILGFINANKRTGNHIITTKIEHPSVLNVCEALEKEGFSVSYLNVDKYGHIDIAELKKLITDKTILVSIMYVNNEIGSVQNIKKIGKLIKDANKKTAFHVDFVQGYCKYKIDVKESNIDFLSISSHKIHGPKGVGFLYKNSDVHILPLILGGGQQNGLRSGTINVPGIVGTMEATKIAYDNFDYEIMHLRKIKTYAIKKIEELNNKYKIITINSCDDDTFAPHILSISFSGIRAEVMLHSLDDKGIYVSAGSACSSHNKHISNTLLSIGLDNKLAESTIRLSFGRFNELSDVDELVKILNIVLPNLIL